jgi:4-hydroxybenzoate polyprenyltransferase
MTNQSISAKSLATYSNFVKLEHTLFSLPLIVAGALLGERALLQSDEVGALSWTRFALIILAAAGARTFALAMNRIIDYRLDAKNPRTAVREIPSGKMSLKEAWGVAITGLVVYLVAVAFLPAICWYLSPVPLIAFVAYPFMKRYTATCHLGVGLGLALAPLAGYVAVTGSAQGVGAALPLAAFALFWVAGFDIIYATLDIEHDRSHGIYSIPAAVGKESGLRVSVILHLLAFAALFVWCLGHARGWLAWLCLVVVGGLLIWEQLAADRVQLAFFRINSWLGFVVLALVWFGLTGGWKWTILP